MLELLSGFSVMAEFAFFVAVGYLGRRLNYLGAAALNGCMELILKIGVPGVILSSAATVTLTGETMANAGWTILLYTLVFVISAVLAGPVSSAFHIPENRKRCFTGAVAFKNISFMGFPLCVAVLGRESLFYAALCTVVFNLANWSYGVWLYSGVQKIRWKKILTNPAMIASFLLVVMILAGIRPSGIIQTTLEAAGSICTPLPLIAVGIMLGDVKFSRLFTDRQIYLISILSLAAVPVLTCILVWIFRVPAEASRVLILLSATPSATMNAVMARQYGSDEQFTSLAILQTTFLSLFTIPLVYLAAQGIFGL
jgi:predicted permease